MCMAVASETSGYCFLSLDVQLFVLLILMDAALKSLSDSEWNFSIGDEKKTSCPRHRTELASAVASAGPSRSINRFSVAGIKASDNFM